MIDTITCPGCTASFPGSSALMGKRVRCRKCKVEFCVPMDASGLDFLEDDHVEGLEFFDEPVEPTVLNAIDDELGLAAQQHAPVGLLERKFVPPPEPKVKAKAPREQWQYNVGAFAFVFSVAFGLVLLGIGWLQSGGDDELYKAFYVIGALCCFVPIAFVADRRLMHYEEYHQFRYLLMILAVILNVIAALVGANQ